jgi:hypothetical protein
MFILSFSIHGITITYFNFFGGTYRRKIFLIFNISFSVHSNSTHNDIFFGLLPWFLHNTSELRPYIFFLPLLQNEDFQLYK